MTSRDVCCPKLPKPVTAQLKEHKLRVVKVSFFDRSGAFFASDAFMAGTSKISHMRFVQLSPARVSAHLFISLISRHQILRYRLLLLQGLECL